MCGVFSRSRSRNKSKDSGEEAGSTMSFDNDFSGTIVRMPRLNEPAPDFHAPTTHGEKRLADYKGHWPVSYTHLTLPTKAEV